MNAEMASNFSDWLMLQHGQGFVPLFLAERSPSTYLASATACGAHSGTSSLTDQTSFELSECTHHMKNKNTAR
ncbi:hypothetical protein WI71_06775 [Burkholderia diffusa]|nr:hypothetical protein WI71_06775 [Burkholderia diffusa]KVG25791.1 hypothetical protein WJ30_28500 [Burkholderia diffusa]